MGTQARGGRAARGPAGRGAQQEQSPGCPRLPGGRAWRGTGRQGTGVVRPVAAAEREAAGQRGRAALSDAVARARRGEPPPRAPESLPFPAICLASMKPSSVAY